jgi:DNA-binding TFAR19-related protein (PDSD5 family)
MVTVKIIGMKLSVFLTVVPILAGCASVKSDYQEARRQNTVETWESFLKKHPDAKQAKCAQIHLAHLRAKKDWQSAESADTSDDYKEHVESHPEVENEELDQEMLVKLQKEQAQQAWQKAQDSDTIDVYEKYLTAFPESANTKAARARIAVLAVNRDWAAAKASNSTAAYQKFLKKHPYSKFNKLAKRRMASLYAENEWQKAKTQNTEAGWVNYIVSNMNTPEAKEAIKRLRKHKVVGPGGIIDWIRVGGKIWSQPRDDGFSNYDGSTAKNVLIKREKQLVYYCRNTTELKFPNWVMLNKIKVTGHLKAGPAGFRLLEGLALVPMKN